MKWRIYVDGASSGNPGHAGAGIVAMDESGLEVGRWSAYLGEMTNNMAEYEALIRGLRKAQEAGATEVEVHTDSELIARQITGEYRVKNQGLRPYFEEAKSLASTFRRFAIEHVPREENKLADRLAKNGSLKKG
jgi:ribonuclease HI